MHSGGLAFRHRSGFRFHSASVRSNVVGPEGAEYSFKTDGFNVFASGRVLRSAGLKGSGHGGSDAGASNAPGAYSFQPSGGLLPLAIWRVL